MRGEQGGRDNDGDGQRTDNRQVEEELEGTNLVLIGAVLLRGVRG